MRACKASLSQHAAKKSAMKIKYLKEASGLQGRVVGLTNQVLGLKDDCSSRLPIKQEGKNGRIYFIHHKFLSF